MHGDKLLALKESKLPEKVRQDACKAIKCQVVLEGERRKKAECLLEVTQGDPGFSHRVSPGMSSALSSTCALWSVHSDCIVA